MFAPIRPSPTIPSCIGEFVFISGFECWLMALALYARASDNDRDLDHVINRDRLSQDAHPDGAQAANDIFSPIP